MSKVQMRKAPWLVVARRILGSGIAALAVGASIVLVANADAAKREARVRQERVTAII